MCCNAAAAAAACARVVVPTQSATKDFRRLGLAPLTAGKKEPAAASFARIAHAQLAVAAGSWLGFD